MFPQLGVMEMVVVMGVAVLLFGKRLPEVGRSLGKGIIEFKKGLRGLEGSFDLTDISTTPSRRSSAERSYSGSSPSSDYPESSVPKFEPPSSAPSPVPHMEYEAPQPHD
jgi:sec-independent protein translocase protein TatA